MKKMYVMMRRKYIMHCCTVMLSSMRSMVEIWLYIYVKSVLYNALNGETLVNDKRRS